MSTNSKGCFYKSFIDTATKERVDELMHFENYISENDLSEEEQEQLYKSKDVAKVKIYLSYKYFYFDLHNKMLLEILNSYYDERVFPCSLVSPERAKELKDSRRDIKTGEGEFALYESKDLDLIMAYTLEHYFRFELQSRIVNDVIKNKKKDRYFIKMLCGLVEFKGDNALKFAKSAPLSLLQFYMERNSLPKKAENIARDVRKIIC